MRRRMLSLTLALISLSAIAHAQASTPPTNRPPEDARVERLAGLARVWGAVKYFHPYLAYRDVDWDKALVEAIPKVRAAQSRQEYEAALDSMLAVLGDKNTRVRPARGATKGGGENPRGEVKEPIAVEDGVLTIDALAVARAIAMANTRMPEFMARTSQNLPSAKAVLIDLRSGGEGDEEVGFFLDFYLRAALPAMLDRDVPLASLRYRVHNGYAPQSGSTSGGYYSGVITAAPESLAGNNKAKTPPLVFLVDERSPSAEMLSGLQAASLAVVVQDGEAAEEAGVSLYTIKLPDGVEVSVRTAELVSPDGRVGFAADATAPKTQAKAAALKLLAENRLGRGTTRSAPPPPTQVSTKDRAYPEMEFPSAEYRLLALFRFWNVINYFFPYKELTGGDWNAVLPRYIPKFEANRDALDYQTTVREMVTELRDSHAGVRGASKVDEKLGTFIPPLLSRYVEGQTVVTEVLDEKAGVRRGDVIVAIDGEPVERRREYLARFFADSTPQAFNWRVRRDLLRGSKESRARLTLKGADGATREVEVARSLPRQDPKVFAAMERTTPVVQVLPGGFGYVDLARLRGDEVDKMFETIAGTPAVIFDMRGYPNGTAWSIAPRLTEKTNVPAALFSRPIWEATSLTSPDLGGGTDFTFTQYLPERKGDAYKGKVVMLINEDAISQAEHTCMFFEAAADVTFVGTPTMGANGDVTNLVLPGNIFVGFSGHDVRHADGRQLQRVGIQPTVRVEPTVRGTAEGRDEILEAAVKFLQSVKAK